LIDLNESIRATPSKEVKTTTMVLIITLVLVLNRGLTQTKGKANGPKHKKAIIRLEVLKYHFSFGIIFIY